MSKFLIDNIVANSGINLNNLTIPSSADDIGTAGDIAWDDTYIYVCVSDNTWKRTPLREVNACSEFAYDIDNWSISGPTYHFGTQALASEDNNIRGIQLHPSSGAIYIQEGPVLRKHILTEGDLCSVSSSAQQSLSLNTDATSFHIENSGNYLFYLIDNIGYGIRVFRHDMSTPWDLSTASSAGFNSYLPSSSSHYDNKGLYIKPDGTKMYIVGSDNSSFSQVLVYNLGTAWNTASNVTYSTSFSLAGQDMLASDITFKPDGLSMYIIGASNRRIYKYELSTAWDISTATVSESSYDKLATASLLLNFDDEAVGSTTFGDRSSNSLAVTAGGDVQVSSTAKYGARAAYFDGDGDYLQISGAPSSLNIGSGDFTVEGWIYSTNNSTNLANSGTIYSSDNRTSASGLNIWFDNNDIVVTHGSALDIHSNNFLPTENSWTHFALARDSTSLRWYINGSLIQANTVNGPIRNHYTNNPTIGESFVGYIDDFRVTKGVARYKRNGYTLDNDKFPEEKTPVTNSEYACLDISSGGDYLYVGGMSVDAVDQYALGSGTSNVVTLLHMDGNPGGQTFTDSSSNGVSWIINDQAPSSNDYPQTYQGIPKFGSASAWFSNETPTGYIIEYHSLIRAGIGTGPNSNSQAQVDNLTLGTEDFTIEMFYYEGDDTNHDRNAQLIGFSSTDPILSFVSGTSNMAFFGNNYFPATGLSVYHHIALVRDATDTRVYLNGTKQATYTGSVINYLDSIGYIGWGFNGLIDELRITKGIGRYTGNSFTVPTSAFPDE